ncbi:hypothetical protein HII13_000289 [Brettanomyces bruxellensis]|nr:hypothetical protein HII13_000289 [Brettanomyces bruxellensis]
MLDINETQIYTTKVSILTIPRSEFWIFKGGILRLIYRLADHYGRRFGGQGGRFGYDMDLSASSLSGSENSNSDSEKSEEDNSVRDGETKEEYSGSLQPLGVETDDDGLFFHLAFASDEVTLMCSSKLIRKYLGKTLNFCEGCLPKEKQPTLLNEKFLILQVSSDGMNIGKKILELTEPLSLDGISLFFISNFFTDVVLFPAKDKQRVLAILRKMSEQKDDPDAEELHQRQERDLETKTFNLFGSKQIKPELVATTKLILTGARSGDSANVLRNTAEALSRLDTDIDSSKGDEKCKSTQFPAHFAITRNTTGEISMMLPQSEAEFRKLNYDKSTIMGSLQDSYCPITIDLSGLPLDLKGIVAGVASRLLRLGINEMSYLSFGKSGMVLIPDNFQGTVERFLSQL